MSAPASRITISKLHPLFAAEVTGIDLSVPIAQDDLNTIWQAFNEHQVLVFRDQHFTDETQIAFSRNFGSLETMEAHAANNYNPGHIAVMTNLDKNGNLLPLDDPGMQHRLRNEAWHSDSSFKPVAALASLLSAREVPPAGVGGNTDFLTARAAYDALPESRKAQIENLTVIHRVAEPKNADDPAYSQEQKKRLTVTHPLVRTNPVNGRKAIYVGSHAQEIIGMSPEAGHALLAELSAHCAQPQFFYSHQWLPGDAVMWDNRCTLHRATTFDKTQYRRKMHRTTVAGLAPDALYATLPERAAAAA
jgi:alpha-ketoglutarate-dependent 2,4-dichlorophenoxyacetate dioxygenase